MRGPHKTVNNRQVPESAETNQQSGALTRHIEERTAATLLLRWQRLGLKQQLLAGSSPQLTAMNWPTKKV